MKKSVLTVTMLTLCSLGVAQTPSPTQAATQSPGITDQCAFTFTSGHDETFLKYCVTGNGNIIQLETPRGHEHLSVAANNIRGEGYGVCDTAGAEYSDYAEFGDSGNWNPATVVSHDAKSVTIARTTSDGILTLTQTFTQVPGISPSARIDMTIANNTDGQRDFVLFRWANVNADSLLQNNVDATLDSAFAWNSTDGNPSHTRGFGLMLQNAAPTPLHHFGFILNVPDPPRPCNAFIHAAVGPLTNIDGSVFVDYLIVLGGHESKTVTAAYKGM